IGGPADPVSVQTAPLRPVLLPVGDSSGQEAEKSQRQTNAASVHEVPSRLSFHPTYGLARSAMATRCPCVRKKSVPAEIAGVAIQISPIGFTESSLNCGPAWTT